MTQNQDIEVITLYTSDNTDIDKLKMDAIKFLKTLILPFLQIM